MILKLPRLRSGSSMIEMLLFVAILGVVGTVMINLLFQATETRVNQETEAAVEQNIAQIAQQLNDTIRQSSDFMMPDNVGDSSAVLALQNDGCETTSPTMFALSGGVMQKITRTSVAAISNDQVAVTSLYFRNTSATSTEKSVFVRFTVSRVVRLMAPRTYSRTFEGTFSLYVREKATCTVDCGTILPGCDGAGNYVWAVQNGSTCDMVSLPLNACRSSSSSSNPCLSTSSAIAREWRWIDRAHAALCWVDAEHGFTICSSTSSSSTSTSSSVASSTSSSATSTSSSSSSPCSSSSSSSTSVSSSSVAPSSSSSSSSATSAPPSSSSSSSAATTSSPPSSSSSSSAATTSSPPSSSSSSSAATTSSPPSSSSSAATTSSPPSSSSSSSAATTSASSPCSSSSSTTTSGGMPMPFGLRDWRWVIRVDQAAAASAPSVSSSSSPCSSSSSSSSAATTSSASSTPSCVGMCMCGDGFCDLNEDCACDCPYTCGNFCCDTGETSGTCPSDCGGGHLACAYVCAW